MKNNLVKLSQSILLLSTLIILSGCATKLPPAPRDLGLQPEKLGEVPKLPPYKIQIGDTLDIKFYLNPELNERVTVRPDGMISTDLEQDIQAAGRTPKELRDEVKKSYSKELTNPKVVVSVRTFMPTRVYVLGEVENPGEVVSVGPNLSLLQAFARSGGLKNSADSNQIIIIRREADAAPKAYHADYDLASNGKDPSNDVRLAPHDIVFVPRTGVANVYVNYEQFVRQFIPTSFGLSYQLNNSSNN